MSRITEICGLSDWNARTIALLVPPVGVGAGGVALSADFLAASVASACSISASSLASSAGVGGTVFGCEVGDRGASAAGGAWLAARPSSTEGGSAAPTAGATTSHANSISAVRGPVAVNVSAMDPLASAPAGRRHHRWCPEGALRLTSWWRVVCSHARTDARGQASVARVQG